MNPQTDEKLPESASTWSIRTSDCGSPWIQDAFARSRYSAGRRELRQVWASQLESHAHSRPQPRKHITGGRERSIHGRHAVRRLHRKNRFPRKLQPANAAVTAEAEGPTRPLCCLPRTRASHDDRRRKTRQPVHASNVITARP